MHFLGAGATCLMAVMASLKDISQTSGGRLGGGATVARWIVAPLLNRRSMKTRSLGKSCPRQ